jgi:hypothetical protein
MAAITPGLESDEVPDAPDAGASAYGDATPPADLARQLVEASHAGLTRFNWNRQLILDHLRGCRYWLEEEPGGATSIRIDPPLPRDLRPWKLMMPNARPGRFTLLGEGNGKMGCPTWDLPAGPAPVGGTCPAANAGQVILPPGARVGMLDLGRGHLRVQPPEAEAPVPFVEAKAICAFCYASEGNYDYTEIQAPLVAKFWWTKEMLATPAGFEEWVRVMAGAILRLRIPVARDQHSQERVHPVRLHSSGDFFSPRYAEAWVAVANAVAERDPSVRFWAPTRTWASPGFAERWPSVLTRLRQPNLVIRASAYHVGDVAPGALADGGPGAPGWARGTTSLQAPPAEGRAPNAIARAFPEAVWTGPDDPRRDYDCPVYALDVGQKSCDAAGCRVCWTRPDLRVNYSLH